MTKTILVTGGSRGDGTVTARMLAGQGYDIAIADAGRRKRTDGVFVTR